MTWVDSAVSIPGGSAGTAQADIDRLTTHTSGWVNVKSFGAVGNGVTDDTAAIQAAATAASSGLLFVPPGTYRTTASIALPASISVRGAGPGLSILKPISAFTTGVLASATSTATDIRDLEIDANYDIAGAYYGVTFAAGSGVNINNVFIHDTGQAGIWSDNVSNGIVRGSRFYNCGRNFGTNNHGIQIGTASGGGTYTDWIIIGNRLIGTYRKAIAFYAFNSGTMKEFVISGNRTEDSGLGGVFVAGTSSTIRDFVISGHTSVGDGDATGGAGISVDTVASSFSISGGSVKSKTGGAHFGVSLVGVSNLTVSGMAVDFQGVHGISLSTVSGATIVGNTVTSSNQLSQVTGAGIYLDAVTRSSVLGNTVSDSSAHMTHALIEQGASDYNTIGPNNLKDGTVSLESYAGANNTVIMASQTAAVSSFTAPAQSGTGANITRQVLTVEGFVQLSGDISSSTGTITAGTTLATLDAAYRPNRSLTLATATSNGTVGFITISTGGVVTCNRNLVSGGEFLRLDGIRYKVTN